MKVIQFFLLVILISILTACPGSTVPSLSKIESNGMNFPDLEQRVHDGIKFKLSSLFKDAYYSEFVIQKNATTKAIYDIQMHFSVETFKKQDIESMEFMTDSKKNNLSLIHDYYIQSRLASLEENSISIRKKVPKEVGFPGYIQVVEGGSSFDDKWASYFTSSIEIDGEIFVFQLIGPKDNMGYFYDDFLRILKSIEK
jgi:hypothetical protein